MTAENSHINFSGEQGFTLFELLVSVAILSLLAVPIAGGINLGLKTWIDVHEDAEAQEKMFLTQERLSGWISNAYYLDVSRNGLQSEKMLVGNSDSIEFSTAIHPDPVLGNLYRTKFRLADNSLQLAFLPDFSYRADGTEWSWSTMLEGVESFQIDYALGTDATKDIVWLSEWGNTIETNGLPRAVKLNLQFVDTTKVWPELIIPLVVKEQAFCRLLSDRTCLAGAFVG